VSFLSGRITARNAPISAIKEKTDTVIVWRTETVEKPIFRTERVTDTIYIAVDKTREFRDTVFVPLPVTQRVYEGQYYDLAVSGYKPTLDYIKVKVPTMSPKHNAVTVGAYGYVWNTASCVPYVGYEYRHGQFSVGGGGGYDFMLRKPVVIGRISFDVFQW